MDDESTKISTKTSTKAPGSRVPGDCAGMIQLGAVEDEDHLQGFEEYLPADRLAPTEFKAQ